jgi:hypothetical protein
VPRSLRIAVRSVLLATALALFLADGWGAVLLPGRFLLDLIGAIGPRAGRWSVFLSAVFYSTAALASVLVRGQLLEADDTTGA